MRSLTLVALLAACSASPAQPLDASRQDAPQDAPQDTADASSDAASDTPDTPLAPRCDVVANDCPDGQKCLISGVGDDRVNTCVALTARLAEGAACTLADVSDGPDDCAASLVCTRLGAPAAEPARCRPLCNTHGDCAARTYCRRLSAGPRSFGGVCLPGCTAFENTCPAGSFCQYVPTPAVDEYAGVCTFAPIARRAGDLCPDGLCGPDTSCTPDAPHRCVSVCDGSHPCPDGHACALDPTFAPGIGTCG